MSWSVEFLEEAKRDMQRVVSARSDDQVYREAARRRSKHDL